MAKQLLKDIDDLQAKASAEQPSDPVELVKLYNRFIGLRGFWRHFPENPFEQWLDRVEKRAPNHIKYIYELLLCGYMKSNLDEDKDDDQLLTVNKIIKKARPKKLQPEDKV